MVGTPGPCGCGCALTPRTSDGFDVEDFAANYLGTPLDPWERWLAIHALELLPDGRPRFRHVLLIVARQNGKTWLLVVLCLFWSFIDRLPLVLSTSSLLDYAKEAWQLGTYIAQTSPVLEVDLPPGGKRGIREANGEQTMTTIHRSRWKIAAANRRAGRSLTVDRLVLDELREHLDWECWTAAVPTTNAVRHAQVWSVSNMGDARAVVLDSRRRMSMTGLDPRMGLFEWSAPEGSDPTDPAAIAQANPNVGRRIDMADLVSAGAVALEEGGEELTKHLTEILCIGVRSRHPAVDARAWGDCREPVDLAEHRSRVACCVDVAMDEQHACLVAAAVLPDGRVAIDVVRAWSGPRCVAEMRRDLAKELRRVRPRTLGWFPGGPAAVVGADLVRAAKLPRRHTQLPARMTVEEITGEASTACMGFAGLVKSRDVCQPDDPMLNAQVLDAEKLMQGDRWRFTRKGVGHCDGAYGSAGAVHLAKLLPPAPPPLSSG